MRPRRLPARTAFAVVLVLTVGACTGGGSDGGTGEPSPSVTTTPAPSGTSGPGAVQDLTFRIASVSGQGVGGNVRAPGLADAADGVRETLDRIYTIGFLDPSAWDGGAFTSLFRSFDANVRPQAHRNLRQLTLGPLAAKADAVRASAASADVRFVADRAGRPVVAVADVTFEATARSADGRADIAQGGRFVLRREDGVWRVAGYRVRARIPSAFDTRGTPADAEFVPGIPSARPTVILVIGSDARPNQAVSTTRADSLHLVAIDPVSGRVSVLGIPRDSWVPIDGHGVDKINASLADGGPELVVRTVERLTGVHVDAYVMTGFDGFVRGVAEIGGIDVDVPYAISDHYAHAQFRPGPEHLGGKQALAFSRARHSLPHGDFDRSLNQGRLLLAALATLRSQVRDGTSAFVRWAVAGSRYLKTDLDLPDLFELLVAAPSFDPRRAVNRVATGSVATISGKSVVLLDAQARAMFHDLARDGVLGG
jgi:LCP family protein required for cell wall assembly